MKNIVNIGDRLEKYIYENDVSNDEWLKILNLAETYGGFKSVKQYSIDNKISVQGVYKHREIHSFINSKFVIDND
jgi:hypothetical protein